MKNAAKIGIPIILAVLLCFLGSFLFKDATYEIDTSKFESTVAYQEEVDLSGLRIVQKRAGLETFINVDESMVTECDPTSSVGDKSMTVTYNELVFTVNFTVKYRVEFLSDADVISTQYVLKANEINLPSDPYKKGFEFDGWNKEIPEVVNDNIRFEAIFRDVPKEIPNLGNIDATYGDTLESIALPYNQYGAWQFVDPLTTPVGNVGKNTFSVKFMPTNTELTVVTNAVNIYVSPMQVKIMVNKTVYYDGGEKIPEYTLLDPKGNEINDPSIVVNYYGEKGTNVGEYFYEFTIAGGNYEGSAKGYFNIVTRTVVITVNKAEMTIGDSVPKMTFKVEEIVENNQRVEASQQLIDLLNIKINVPKINNAGYYDVSIEVNNSNYTSENILKEGCEKALHVKPMVLETTGATVITQAYYGDKLSDIIIAHDNPNGYWKWNAKNENGESIDAEKVVLNRTGSWEIDIIFIPNSQNYAEIEAVYPLTVHKKELTINFDSEQNVYVYEEDESGNGIERKISYTVEGFVLGDTLEDVKIIDKTTGEVENIKSKDVINYATVLEVVSDNYCGEVNVSLQITQASYNIKFENVVVSEGYITSKLGTVEFLEYYDEVNNKYIPVSELPGTFEWEANSVELKELGLKECGVKFIPTSDNYKVEYGKITIDVLLNPTSIIIPDKITGTDYHYIFDYNGTQPELTGISKEHKDHESSLVYTYYFKTTIDGKETYVEVDEMINAGEYKVVISLAADDKKYDAAENTVYVCINKVGVDGEPSSFIGVYGQKLSDLADALSLYNSQYGEWKWENLSDEVGEAGINVHTAIFTPYDEYKDNYNTYSKEVSINVAKREVTFVINEEDNKHAYQKDTTYQVVFKIKDGDTTYTEQEAKDILGIVVEGNTAHENAGTYYITLKVSDSVKNFKGSYSNAKLVISSIDPDVSHEKLGLNGEIIYGTHAFDYSSLLEEGFSFKENYLFDEAGADLPYLLTYNPNDTNYNTIDVEVLITVSKADATVSFGSVSSSKYTGSAITVKGTTTNTDGVELSYVYTLNGVEVSEIKDAGTYKVTIISPESDNFNEGKLENYEVVISKVDKNVTWTNVTYTYSANGQDLPTVGFYDVNNSYVEFDKSIITVKDLENDGNTEFKNVSLYELGLNIPEEFTKNYNFNESSLTKEYSIGKATIDTSAGYWNNNSFTYDGNKHTVSFVNVRFPSDVTVTYNGVYEATDVGDYTATISLSYDLINYNPIEIEEASWNWSISEFDADVNWENADNKEYSGSVFDQPKAFIYDVNGDKYYLDVTMDKTEFKNVGNYVFTANDPTNNYELSNTIKTINVSKTNLEVEWDYAGSYTYSGSAFELPKASITTLDKENDEYIVIELDPIISSAQDEFKLAGTYSFSVSFEHANYNITNTILNNIVINKATYDMSTAKWGPTNSFTYSNEEKEVTVSGLPGGVVVKEESYSGNKATVVGNYTASVELEYDEDNYNSVSMDSYSWSIVQKEVEVAWNVEASYTYGENFDKPTASFTDLKGNSVLINVNEKNGTPFINSGDYIFVASFDSGYADIANYTIINSEKPIYVEKAEEEVTVPMQATYGNELGEIELPTSPYGVWSLHQAVVTFSVSSTQEATDKVGNVGTRTVLLDFTPYPEYAANFKPLVGVEVSLVVAPKKLEVSLEINDGVYGNVSSSEATGENLEDGDTLDFTFTYQGVDYLGNPYNSTTAPDQAGTYTVTITNNNPNYAFDEVVKDYVVKQATPTTYFDNYTFDAVWNTKLGDVDLTGMESSIPGTYSFKEPNALFSEMGINAYEAIFTPEDLNNYEVILGVIKVNVIKATYDMTGVKWNYEEAFTYSASAKTVELTNLPTGVTVATYSGNSAINAGSYTAKATTFNYDDVHYNAPVFNETLSWEIEKATANVTWSYAQDGYTYDEDGQVAPKAYIYDLADTQYKELVVKEKDSKEFYNAGVYNFVASLPDALQANYVLGANVNSNEVTIEKATLDLTNAIWDSTGSFTYNGEAQGMLVTGVTLPSDVVINYVDNSFVNAGDYTAKATLEYNSNNYDVLGELPEDKSWSIAKKEATVNWENEENKQYTSNLLAAPKAFIYDVNGDKFYLTVSMDKVEFKDAGTYTFEATDATQNYLLSNETKQVEVEKASLTVVWTYANEGYTYTGEELALPNAYVTDLKGNKIYLKVTILDGDVVFVDAGDYIFTAAFDNYSESDNYTLTNADSSLVTVKKAKYDMSGASWNYVDPFTYSNEEKEVFVTGFPSGVTVKGYEGNSATNVGTYTATVEFDYENKENYEQPTLEPLTWKINPKEINVTWNKEASYTYSSNVFDTPTATFVDLKGNDVVINVVESSSKEFRNAGDYEFIASFENGYEDKDNYVIVNDTLDINVAKKVLDLPTGLEATYGQTLNDIKGQLPTSAFGTWSFDVANPSETTVGDANALGNPVDVKFTSTNANYADVEGTTKVVVEAKDITVTINASNSTFGSVVTPTAEFVGLVAGDEVEPILTYTGTVNNGSSYNSTVAPDKAGSYRVTVTIDDDNYNLTNVTYKEYLINRAAVTANFDDEVFNIAYGTLLKDVDVSSLTASVPGTYSFVNPNAKLVDMGEGEYEARFTPNDTNNYLVSEGLITINVIQATYDMSEVKWDYEEAFVYNAEEREVKLINLPDGVTAVYENNAATNVGEYTARVVSFNYDTTRYLAPVFAELTKDWEIEKATADVIWVYAQGGYTYDVDGQIAPKAYIYDLADKTNKELVVTEKDSKEFHNAGDYNFVASLPDALQANYVLGANVNSDEVTIGKATIDTSKGKWSDDAFEYDGETHTVVFEGIDWPSDITIEYDGNSGSHAQNYTASITITYNTNNYNEIVVSPSVHDWEISATRKTVIWENADDRTYTSNSFNAPTAYIMDGDTRVDLEVTPTTSFKEVGTYTFEATDTTGNYELINPTKVIVVSKHSLTVVWTYANEGYTYTGEELALPNAYVTDLKGNEVELVVTIKEGNLTFENAGSYIFEAAFNNTYVDKNNYSLVNFESSEVVVNKAKYDMNGASWNYEDPFTYSNEEKTVSVTGLPNGVTVKGYEGNSATNVGTYTATVEFDYENKENYEQPTLEPLTWKINPKEISVTWNKEASYTYSSNVFDTPTATFVDLKGNDVVINVVESSSKEFRNAGDYEFIASFENGYEDKDNYVIVNDTLDINVAKKVLDLPTNLIATYGQTLEDIKGQLPVSAFGTWSFDNEEAKVGNVGNNAHNISFVSTDSNYADIDSEEVNVNVSAKNITVTINASNSTFGSVVTPTAEFVGLVTGDLDKPVLTYSGSLLNGDTYGPTTTVPSRAGNYTVTASVNNANYRLTGTIRDTFSIAKINPEVEDVVIAPVTWKEGMKLSDITIGDTNFAWADANESVGSVGTQEFDAIYTPDNTNDYNQLVVKLSVSIAKATYDMDDVTWNYTSAFTYDATEKVVGLTNLPTGVTVKTYDGNTATNAGNYTASVLEFNYDNTHYNAPVFNETLSWEILKAKVALPTGLEATYEDVLSSVTFTNPEQGTWAWNTPAATVGNAGVQTHTATFTPNPGYENNYESFTSTEVKVNVAKKVLDLPTNLTAIYGQTLSNVQLPESAFGTWSFDDGSIKVGDVGNNTHNISFESTDSNYADIDSAEINVAVTAKDITVTINASNSTFGSVVTPTAEFVGLVAGDVNTPILTYSGTLKNGEDYASTTTVPSRAGNYTVTVSNNNANYNLTGTVTKQFEIAKANPTYVKPSIAPTTWKEGLKLSDIEIGDTHFTWVDGNTVINEVGDSLVFVANYTPDNTNDYNVVPVELSLRITKATYDMSGVAWNYTSAFTYDSTAKTVELTNLPTGVTVATYSGNTATNAGSYTASVVAFNYDDTHYNAPVFSKTLSWEILKARVALPTGLNATYGDVLSNVTFTNPEQGTWAWNTPTATVGNAGVQTHTATFTPNPGYENNYESFTSNEVKVEVAKKQTELTMNIPNNLVYTSNIYDHTSWVTTNLPNGSITYVITEDGNTVNLVQNAGSYSIRVTNNNANYTAFEETYNFTVSKAVYSHTNLPSANSATYGTQLKDVTLSGGDGNGTWSWLEETNTVGNVNASGNDHEVKFVHNSGNYEDYVTTIKVVVTKAEPVGEFKVTTNTITYEQTLASMGLTFDSDVPGTAYWVLGNNTKPAATNGTLYDVRFVPEDQVNYNVVNRQINVIVNKKATTLTTTNDSYTFVYGEQNNVLDKTLLGISVSSADVERTVKFYNGNEEITTLTDVRAEAYNITVKVLETDNYLEASKEISIKINPARVSYSLEDTYEYGTTLDQIKAQLPASTYGTFDLSVVNGYSLSSPVNTAVKLDVTFSSTNTNYASYVDTIEITIVPRKITATIDAIDTTYGETVNPSVTLNNVANGENPTITYLYTGTENNGSSYENSVAPTNAGSYTVAITVADSNYELIGSNSDTFLINKAKVYADAHTFEAKYNTKLQNISLAERVAKSEVTDEVVDGSFAWNSNPTLNAIGSTSAVATFTPENTYNYEVNSNITFTVNVVRLDSTVSLVGLNNLTYSPSLNETVTNANLSINHGEATNIQIVVKYNDAVVGSLTKAGDYYITVSFAQTTHYNAYENTFIVNVAQATPVTDFSEVKVVEYSENLTLANITLSNGYSWINPETALDNIEANVAYPAKYTPTDPNYREVTGEIKVTVNKANIVFTKEESYSFDYNGSARTISVGTNNTDGANVEYSYELLNTSTSNYETVSEMKDAGTYRVTIISPDSAHYNAGETTATVVINAINMTAPTGITAVYGQTLNDVLTKLNADASAKYGTWTMRESLDTKVGDVTNSSTFYANFTSSSVNYNSTNDIPVAVKVNQGQAVISTTANYPTTSLAYEVGGYEHEPWFSSNFGTMSYTITVVKFDGTNTSTAATKVSDAGTYTIVVSVEGNSNYLGDSETYTVVVAQATYTDEITEPTGLTAVYSQSPTDIEAQLKAFDTNAGTWSWDANAADFTDKIGGVTRTAWFTPKDINYAPVSKPVTITVSKKTLTINVTYSEFDYNGETQYILYEIKDGNTVLTDKQIEDYGITVTGNTGWINASDSGQKTLSIVSDFYQGSATPTLVISQGTPIVNGIITGGDFYEDRLSASDIVGNATASVDGEFQVLTSLVYGSPETNVTYDTITVEWKFIPDDEINYKEVTGQVNINIHPVAYVGSTYFGTVDKAIAQTNTGTIVVIPGTNPIIKTNNLTIASGVTLFLPHTEGNSAKGNANEAAKAKYHADGSMNDAQTQYLYTFENPSSDNGTYDGGEVATSLSNRLKSTLYISSGVTLTNNGTIEIDGELSGGGGGSNFAGQTYGYYSRIVLKSSAHIESNGTINCYGYIEEESLNNGSSITVNNGAKVYMPYILRDFRGGSYMYAVYSKRDTYETTPFNQFEFRNITSTIRYNYGSSLKGWANLYAGSQRNFTNVDFMGTTSSSFIQMTDATYSYAISKYNPNTEVTKFDLYGGASTSSIKLEVKVLGTITMDTTDYYFPLSWRFDISLNKAAGQTSNAQFSMSQKYKLLPGAKLTVNNGADLALGELNIYENWTDTIVGLRPYGEGKSLSGAQFIVNGTVNANYLGGKVLTNGSTGKLTVNTKSSLVTYESTGAVNGSSISASVAFKSIANSLELHLYKNGSVDDVTTSVGIGSYIAKNNGWYATKGIISYDGNFGTITGSSQTDEFTIGDNGYTITEQDIPDTDPTRNHYSFSGWYYEIECTTPVSLGDVIFTSVTFYAKWTPVTYGITYVDTFYSNTDSGTSITNSASTFNIESFTMFGTPTNGSLVFDGFYLDSSYNIKVNMINGEEFVDYLTDSSTLDANGRRYVTVYLYWYPEGTDTYTINYVNPKNGELDSNGELLGAVQSIESDSFVIALESEWEKQKLPVLNTKNTDKSYNMYFDGWYSDSNYTNEVTSINALLFTGDSTTITLYAKWVNKNKMNVKVKYYSGNEIAEAGSVIWYIPGETFVVPTNISNYFSSTDYVAIAVINGKDYTLGSSVPTSEFDVEEECIVNLHKLLSVSLTLTQVTNCGYTNTVTIDKGYIYSNGSLSKEGYSVSEGSTSTVTMVEGTIFTFDVTAKVKTDSSLSANKKVTQEVTQNTTLNATAAISYKYYVFPSGISLSIQ